jgi:salicylate hydroxylase
MPSTIRIAISGGGIAGASLLRAILPLPHIDAHIFESAPKFREAGVAFGIETNAREALELMGSSPKTCLERAGGVPMDRIIGYVA